MMRQYQLIAVHAIIRTLQTILGSASQHTPYRAMQNKVTPCHWINLPVHSCIDTGDLMYRLPAGEMETKEGSG